MRLLLDDPRLSAETLELMAAVPVSLLVHHDPFDRLGLVTTCHCDDLDTPVLF